ncbi:MAG: LysR family transcriptional regulator [Polyangiaceae bacterium]
MDRFDAMTAFVTVAELRGFAPAARKLRLSPPMVTRLVAALEAHVGLRLFQRTTRSVTLTDAGKRYLDQARRILSAVEDAERAARAEAAVPTGRLSVAAPLMFGRLEVAPLLCEFLRQHPGVVGDLTLSDRMVNLLDEGVDVAIRIGVLQDSSQHVRPVGKTRRVLVASPEYLKRRKRPRTPEDLRSHAIIQLTSLAPTPEWRFWTPAGEVRIEIRPVLVTNSADAAIGHASLGGGVTMALSYQVQEAVRAGRLQIVLPQFEPPPSPIQIVYPAARLMSASLRAFIDLAVRSRSWDFVDV